MANNLSTLEEISRFCSSHSEAHLIVDTSALVLFLVGIYNPDYIKICPLLTENGKFYDKQHFELIKKVIARFPNKIIITPHVLAEVNMLSKKVATDKRTAYFLKMISELKNHKEHCVPMKLLLENGAIIEFGFTDVSLAETANQNKWIILTDDLPFFIAFNEKIPMISFSRMVAAQQVLV
jgi:hypothetical protein